MTDIVLTNARVVADDEVFDGSVVIRGETILSVDRGRSQLPSARDCDGQLLMPGLIELHTDNMERHLMPRPGSYWPIHGAILNHDREVVSCGITTVFDALCVGDVSTQSIRTMLVEEFAPAMDALIAAGSLKADHHLHLRCEVSFGKLTELLDGLMEQPRLRLMSVMDHTPGQRQFQKIEKYAEYYQGKFGLTDDELARFMAQRRADQERFSAPNRALVVRLAQDAGVALASHDDATAAHVDEAVRDGMKIAEFPTTIEAAEASHKAGMAVLMGGPNLVRGQSHSGNVSARELAERELLDIISSDYVPSSLLYGAMLMAEQVEGMSLPKAVAAVTRTPAQAAGLEDRGALTPGLRADIIRVQHGTAGLPGNVPVVSDVWVGGVRVA